MPVSATTTPWRAGLVGRDTSLVRRAGGATMIFALGPPRGNASRDGRLNEITRALPESLSAVAHCNQVHGARVHRLDQAGDSVIDVGDGDALITTTPGVGVLVWTADCVPVLLSGPGVVAAVHSGWRGCAADVVGVAVGEIQRTAGADPCNLSAALGPAVCGSCYQVGGEVSEALRPFDLDEGRWLDGDRVDLRGFLAARLEALGVPADQIEAVGGCTVESPVLASYRRDGEAAGRQWSMVFLDD
ncbi:MAG: polyphenol oxidase family protein [Thermoanaerobaculales bacterium]|jgi:YfiH family protein|nr:polyphenol oxidase family protein [Thermoanaerobaculales bacterium]